MHVTVLQVTIGPRTDRPQHTSYYTIGMSPKRLRQYDGLIKGGEHVLKPHRAVLQSMIKPPGPAYYEPRDQLPRSFLLNTKKKWTA